MDKTEILKEKLADAEVVLIGIGEEFNEKFDRIAEHEQLVKGLELVDAKEELAWMVPYFEKIYLQEQNQSDILSAYRNLYELVKDKNYYIVTTCIDGLIQKAGFKPEKIVEPCGNYEKMQCSVPFCLLPHLPCLFVTPGFRRGDLQVCHCAPVGDVTDFRIFSQAVG